MQVLCELGVAVLPPSFRGFEWQVLLVLHISQSSRQAAAEDLQEASLKALGHRRLQEP